MSCRVMLAAWERCQWVPGRHLSRPSSLTGRWLARKNAERRRLLCTRRAGVLFDCALSFRGLLPVIPRSSSCHSEVCRGISPDPSEDLGVTEFQTPRKASDDRACNSCHSEVSFLSFRGLPRNLARPLGRPRGDRVPDPSEDLGVTGFSAERQAQLLLDGSCCLH
jgi:hypothetical protein